MQVAAGDHEGILVPEGVVVMLAQLQRPFSQE
jgi:hypothetical protein